MKFGAVLPSYGEHASASAIREVALLAEELGYDSIWGTDHVLVPEQYRRMYGRTREIMTTLAYVAALTSRVSIGTSLLVAPLRHPALMAKQAATLDDFSDGRVILAMGSGYMEKEFEFLNVEFKERGKRFDEAIALMRAIWTEDPVRFKGKFYSVDEGFSYPKPKKAPPIWIGGTSDSAIMRAARLGDGWHPDGGTSPEEFEAGAAKLREWAKGRKVSLTLRQGVDMRDTGGRKPIEPGKYHIGGSASTIIAQVGEYADSGMEHLLCEFAEIEDFEARPGSLVNSVKAFAKEIIPSFR